MPQPEEMPTEIIPGLLDEMIRMDTPRDIAAKRWREAREWCSIMRAVAKEIVEQAESEYAAADAELARYEVSPGIPLPVAAQLEIQAAKKTRSAARSSTLLSPGTPSGRKRGHDAGQRHSHD